MKTANRFASMLPYVPIEPIDVLASRLGLPVEKIIKLDANENPYGPSPLVRKALRELNFINIYPDPESRSLRAALSEVYNVPFESLMAGSGADELIDLLLRVLLEPGDTVLNCPPTFGMYNFDTILNYGTCINIPRKSDFSLDLNEILLSVEKYQPKIIFICSPNNPDGSLISQEDIKFLLSLPALIVLDEAYVEFTQQNNDLGKHRTLISQVKNRENLIVLRTFSKWAGLAGLRVGYGAFPDWLVSSMWKAKQPYNVNIAANAAALISLKDRENLARNITKIQTERFNLIDRLRKFPQLTSFPTQSNFALCKISGDSAIRIKDKLASSGIFIRHYDSLMLRDCIRISVGRPEDTDALIKQLEMIL
jgi:histidinol-phosphate aminotransferase